jgi:hypothetical protein
VGILADDAHGEGEVESTEVSAVEVRWRRWNAGSRVVGVALRRWGFERARWAHWLVELIADLVAEEHHPDDQEHSARGNEECVLRNRLAPSAALQACDRSPQSTPGTQHNPLAILMPSW